MADEKVIITVEIDETDALKSIDNLTTEMIENTTAINANKKALKELDETSEDYADDLHTLTKEQKALSVEKTDINKKYKTAKGLIDAEANSINGLRAKNKALTSERNSLNLATKEGQKRLKEINGELDKNNKTIKDNSDELSKQKQNIGNYASAWQSVPGPLKTVQAGFNTLLANPIFAVIAAFVFVIQQLKEAFERSADGQNVLARAMGFLSGLVTVLQQGFDALAKVIIGAFTEPKKAITALWEFIKSQVVNRVTGLVDVFINLGKTIGNALSLNLDAAAESAKDLGQSLIQASTGFDAEQQAKAFDALAGAIEGVNETVAESIRLEERKLDLRRADAEAVVSIAKLEAEIAVKRAEASDKTLEASVRLEAVAEAEQAVSDKLGEQIALATERFEIKKRENELAESSLEDVEEERRLEGDLIKLRGQRATELRTFVKLRVTTLDELADKETKQLQATAKLNAETKSQEQKALVEGFDEILATAELSAKKRVDIEKLRADAFAGVLASERKDLAAAQKEREKLSERDLEATRELADKRLEVERAALLESLGETRLAAAKRRGFAEQDFEASMEDLERRLAEGALTEQEFALAAFEAEQAFETEKEEAAEEKREEGMEQEGEWFEERLALAEERAETERGLLEESLAAGKLTREQFAQAETDLAKRTADEVNAIGKDRLKKQAERAGEALGIAQQGFGMISQATSDALQAQANIIDARAAEELAELQEKFDSGLLSQKQFDEAKEDLEKKVARDKYQQELKTFKVERALSLAGIAIDTARAVAKSVAASPLTFGLPWSAFAAGVGIAQAAVVLSKKPPPAPSFAEGGALLGGRSHAQGGEDVRVGGRLVANVQGGEGLFVTKREATRDALSYINRRHGGRGFQTPGRTRSFQEGGLLGAAAQQITTGQITEAMREAFEDMPAPVTRITDLESGFESRRQSIQSTKV